MLPSELISTLRERFGDIVSTDPGLLETYSRDETPGIKGEAEVVLRPRHTADISAIMRFAFEHQIPVTPRGAGSGLSGGAVPIMGGIVLSLERLNRILEIDRENLQAIVEPAVITQTLHEEVEAQGLYYPPDPSSRAFCSIGGNVAECAGGPRAIKYGVTKDYVLGLEAVLPDGTVIETGSHTLKDVCGYNITQLLIGSEGTLAVVTKIIVRLIPKPKIRKLLLVPFTTVEAAALAVTAIFQEGLTPSAVELMEHAAIAVTAHHLGRSIPNANAGAQLLIEVDGPFEDTVDREIELIAEVVGRFPSSDAILAEDPSKMEDLWSFRRAIGAAVKARGPCRKEDTVVPRAQLPRLIRGVHEIVAAAGMEAACFGHAADGNVHVNIMKASLSDDLWGSRINDVVRDVLTLVISLGGAISAEHGIGLSQRAYLPLQVAPAVLRLMKDVKKVFDPRQILNPGKIFID